MKLRKAQKKLDARRKAYDEHGQNPAQGNNPSNGSGRGHDMKRPGSMK